MLPSLFVSLILAPAFPALAGGGDQPLMRWEPPCSFFTLKPDGSPGRRFEVEDHVCHYLQASHTDEARKEMLERFNRLKTPGEQQRALESFRKGAGYYFGEYENLLGWSEQFLNVSEPERASQRGQVDAYIKKLHDWRGNIDPKKGGSRAAKVVGGLGKEPYERQLLGYLDLLDQRIAELQGLKGIKKAESSGKKLDKEIPDAQKWKKGSQEKELDRMFEKKDSLADGPPKADGEQKVSGLPKLGDGSDSPSLDLKDRRFSRYQKGIRQTTPDELETDRKRRMSNSTLAPFRDNLGRVVGMEELTSDYYRYAKKRFPNESDDEILARMQGMANGERNVTDRVSVPDGKGGSNPGFDLKHRLYPYAERPDYYVETNGHGWRNYEHYMDSTRQVNDSWAPTAVKATVHSNWVVPTYSVFKKWGWIGGSQPDSEEVEAGKAGCWWRPPKD